MKIVRCQIFVKFFGITKIGKIGCERNDNDRARKQYRWKLVVVRLNQIPGELRPLGVTDYEPKKSMRVYGGTFGAICGNDGTMKLSKILPRVFQERDWKSGHGNAVIPTVDDADLIAYQM